MNFKRGFNFDLKNIVLWTLAGAVFGVAFGLIASIFQGGPTPLQGVKECWAFFAAAGFIKACTDPRKPRAQRSHQSGKLETGKL